jgi:hypothetical protein
LSITPQRAFNDGAGDLQGVQVGVLNLCGDSNGFQCGLVNIANKQEGTSLGLVNIASNGENGPVVWWDNFSNLNVGYKFRINHLYSIFAVSERQDNDLKLPVSLAFYLGGHFPVANFALETDLGFTHSEPFAESTDTDQKNGLQYRVMLRWQKRFFSVFAGGGVAYSFDIFETDKQYFEMNSHFLPLYLGGVQLSF